MENKITTSVLKAFKNEEGKKWKDSRGHSLSKKIKRIIFVLLLALAYEQSYSEKLTNDSSANNNPLTEASSVNPSEK